MAEQTQKTALSMHLDLSGNEFYFQWNRVDADFLLEFKKLTARKELDWLGSQASSQRTNGGDWKVYRIRDQVSFQRKTAIPQPPPSVSTGPATANGNNNFVNSGTTGNVNIGTVPEAGDGEKQN
jgi:hypothetical protein